LAQNEHVQRVSCAGMSMSTRKAFLPQWQLPVTVMGVFVFRENMNGLRAVDVRWYTSGKDLFQAVEH
jgi:hypothetical protein